jgi:hypothetical protein
MQRLLKFILEAHFYPKTKAYDKEEEDYDKEK